MTKLDDPRVMNDLLSLSHVPRWVIVPRLKDQSVADHSYRVAIITMELCSRLELKIHASTLIWALVHDAGECRSGDISGVFKTDEMRTRDLEMTPWVKGFHAATSSAELLLVKLADHIETCTWIAMNLFPHSAHAHHASTRTREKCLEFAGRVAEAFGWGPEKFQMMVVELMHDILGETGRFPAGQAVDA